MRATFDASGDVIAVTGGANGISRAVAGIVTLHQLCADRFVAPYFTDVRRRPSIPSLTAAMAHYAVSRWDAPLDGGLRDRSRLDVGSGVETRLGVAADTMMLVRPDDHVAAIESMTEGAAEKIYQRFTGRPSDTEAKCLTTPGG